MSVIGLDDKANKHVKDVCKMGQGASCCKYLVMAPGKGWECMRTNPKNKKVIDDNWATTPHVAQGDNCDGFGKKEADKKKKEREQEEAEKKKDDDDTMNFLLAAL